MTSSPSAGTRPQPAGSQPLSAGSQPLTTTTLAAIRRRRPCGQGWRRLLEHLGKTGPDDEPLPFETILDCLGLDDTLWCCRAAPQHDREWRMFAVWCGRQVQHKLTDPQSIAALDVAERFVRGEVTDDELAAARAVARAAVWAAVGDAVQAAAEAAAWAPARDAAKAAKAAAWAAREFADAEAWATKNTWDAARAAWRATEITQAAEFRRIVRGEPA